MKGQFKWGWLNHIPALSVIGKLTPVGRVLHWVAFIAGTLRMGHKSQSVFGAARFYLNEHPDEKISPLAAYYNKPKPCFAKQVQNC